MDKLQMAHDYLLKTMRESPLVDDVGIEFAVDTAWKYADAMQAEAEKRVNKERPNVLKEEWQPDWSQAPDNAIAWVYSKIDKSGFWCNKPPIKLNRGWCTSAMLIKAPLFDYQGNWQDSLRKRPQ